MYKLNLTNGVLENKLGNQHGSLNQVQCLMGNHPQPWNGFPAPGGAAV